MSVSTTRLFAQIANYVPFRGFDRSEGPVGSVALHGEATGDGSGGTVEIVINMRRQELGFHPIMVMTRVSTEDELATPAVVQFRYRSGGNERLSFSLGETNLAVAAPDGTNIAEFRELGVMIEPDAVGGGTVMSALWATNENADTYHFVGYGVIYDAEALARNKRPGKGVDDLLAGIR